MRAATGTARCHQHVIWGDVFPRTPVIRSAPPPAAVFRSRRQCAAGQCELLTHAGRAESFTCPSERPEAVADVEPHPDVLARRAPAGVGQGFPASFATAGPSTSDRSVSSVSARSSRTPSECAGVVELAGDPGAFVERGEQLHHEPARHGR
ncbi:hypothetical protein [Amycolatopsis sp. MtRt-6]|uniref:hypothetical protein n=1 Tax=Amycolatopsis sp. MtRt-6 TaxID=2792782 RepID=UPI001A8E9B36|nr:hypothetical protein [Amycolatopsis sp. MtRt-6]